MHDLDNWNLTAGDKISEEGSCNMVLDAMGVGRYHDGSKEDPIPRWKLQYAGMAQDAMPPLQKARERRLGGRRDYSWRGGTCLCGRLIQDGKKACWTANRVTQHEPPHDNLRIRQQHGFVRKCSWEGRRRGVRGPHVRRP